MNSSWGLVDVHFELRPRLHHPPRQQRHASQRAGRDDERHERNAAVLHSQPVPSGRSFEAAGLGAKGWQITTDGPPLGSYFSIKAGANTVVTAKLLPPGPSAVGEVEFIQDVALDNLNISGGAVFEFVTKQ